MLDLFAGEAPWQEPLAPGAVIIRRLAAEPGEALLAAITEVAAAAPWRHLVTPGGHTMSVAMTSCGHAGWHSDTRGYRYSPVDPLSHQPWPAMPSCFMALSQQAAILAGYPSFCPDSCLINRYDTGAKMSLHQDKDEATLAAPIVSVSLGAPAVFQFGGLARSAPCQRILLEHGDVVVWGGPSRLNYHGILPLKPANHPLTGHWRYNLTFRHGLKTE